MQRLGIVLAGCALVLAAAGQPVDQVTLPAGRHPRDVHEAASRVRLAARLGVTEAALERLYAALAAPDAGTPSAAARADVERLPVDTDAARTAWVTALAAAGPAVLDADLFAAVFDRRIALNRELPIDDPERGRTLVLLAFVEDLIRDRRVQQGLPAAWYDRAGGFLDGDTHDAFAYADGDILLVLGGSSVSSLITQATTPQRRFSHALMLRIRDGDFRTLESLIETGAVSYDRERFAKAGINAVQVLRWHEPAARTAMARAASDRAQRFVDERRPYDPAMDLGDPRRLFCSELVARAYHEASGLPLEAFIPASARVRSDAVLAYLKNIGVRQSVMISPGDLTSSPRLEVVAEFRDVGSLFRLWELMLMGDVFVERLEAGYRFRPRLWSELTATLAGTGDLLLRVPSTIPGIDLSLIPASLTTRALAYLMTQEKILYAVAYREAARLTGMDETARMSTVIPWVYRGALSYAIQEHPRLRSVLRPPRRGLFRRGE